MNDVQLVSKEQWVTHEKDVPSLLATAKDKQKRTYTDLSNLADAVNALKEVSGFLPVVHPDDPTSGIFSLTNPIAIQIRIGGVPIITIDANGMRMGA